jgi:hypothetical protein
MTLTLTLLAQTQIPDSLLGWLTGSAVTVLAFIVWAFITGKIHSDKELQRVVGRCDEEFKRIAGKLDAAEAELRERNKDARETLVPTLVKATDLLARYLTRSDNTPPPRGRA